MARKRKVRSSGAQQSEEPSLDQVEEQAQMESEDQQQEQQVQAEQEGPIDDVQEQGEHQNQDDGLEDQGEGSEAEEDEDGDEDEVNDAVEVAGQESVLSEANGVDESSNGEEELEEEPVENLLEPFSKEQLVLLLKEAVSKYPEFVGSVQKIADADPAHRKIFVYGLGWDSTAETLTAEFGKYGEIEDCKAVVDKVSGKSKGYAFILFKHRSGAQRALKEPQKRIGNRTTSCQLASAGPVQTPPVNAAPPVSEYTQRKIFVSNVSADVDPAKLTEFFSKYGEIEDGPLGLDKQTGRPKGFALYVYKTTESAKKALEEPHKKFEGQVLHCQKAIDGPKVGKPFHHHHQQPYQQYHQTKKTKYSSGGGTGPGHLMAPSGPSPVGAGYNPAAVPPAALAPALGQALTALLTSQGAGLGISNLLGGLGASANQQGIPPAAGYGNQGGGIYGAQPGMQPGGYQNPQMGQGGTRPQQGGASYMGHGAR